MHHPSIRNDCCQWKRNHLLEKVVLDQNLATDGAPARPKKKPTLRLSLCFCLLDCDMMKAEKYFPNYFYTLHKCSLDSHGRWCIFCPEFCGECSPWKAGRIWSPGRAAACSLSGLVTGMGNLNNTSYTDTRWSTLGRWHVFSAQASARVFPPNDLLFSFSQQN